MNTSCWRQDTSSRLGVRRDALQALISHWLGQAVAVHNVSFHFPRGPLRWLVPLLEKTSLANHLLGGMRWLRFAEKPEDQERNESPSA